MKACVSCKYVKAGLLGAVLLAAAGLTAYGFDWWPFARAEEGAIAVPNPERAVPLEAKGPKHLDPQVVLNLAVARLHQEALDHFHADPRNGMRRMTPVYTKITREWKMPFISPGELEGAEPPPFRKDLETIHDASMRDFFNPAAKDVVTLPGGVVTVHGGVVRIGLGSSDDIKKWDELNKHKKFWEAKNIDLVGLIKHDEPVVYISEKLAESKGKPPIRPLDDFEMVGLNALAKGEDLFARSRDGVVRVLGSVRANASCLSCHDDKKAGDLLGAFSYTLREAEYKSGFGRPGGAK